MFNMDTARCNGSRSSFDTCLKVGRCTSTKSTDCPSAKRVPLSDISNKKSSDNEFSGIIFVLPLYDYIKCYMSVLHFGCTVKYLGFAILFLIGLSNLRNSTFFNESIPPIGTPHIRNNGDTKFDSTHSSFSSKDLFGDNVFGMDYESAGILFFI